MNDEINKILAKWSKETLAKMIAVLTSQNKVATKTLINSLKVKYGENFVQFIVADYGHWVESGSKAHWIPVDKYPGVAKQFLTWASAKPGIPAGVKKAYATKVITNKGFIHVKQQKPVKFFSDVIEKEIDNLFPQLQGSIIEYIEGKIKVIEQSK